MNKVKKMFMFLATCTLAAGLTGFAACAGGSDSASNNGLDQSAASGSAEPDSGSTSASTSAIHEHAYSSPVYAWSEDKATCTATEKCAFCDEEISETVNSSAEITTAATCTAEGEKTYTATFTNADFSAQTTKGVIPATGHAYGTPAYVWSADNATCIAKATCATCDDEVSETAIAATKINRHADCTHPELTTYSVSFKSEIFSSQTKTEVETSPATGHTYGEVSYIWSEDKATCTATKVCANGDDTVTETVDSVATITTEATCTAGGEKTYTATFTKEGFAVQTAKETLPATGHTYGEVSYTWSEDKATCTATKVCANGDDTVTETVDSVATITTEATCTAGGEKTYTATFTKEGFAVQTAKETLPATGHAYGEATYEWTEDNTACTATKACVNGDKSLVEKKKAVITREDCSQAGTATYTVTFSNEEFETQTKNVEVEAGEHTTDEATFVWSDDYSTCTATVFCTVCGKATKSETVKAAATVLTEPTCTEKGEAQYDATFEDSAFRAQSKKAVVPATGHTYVNSFDEESGILTKTCEKGDDTVKVECETMVGDGTYKTTAPKEIELGKTYYMTSSTEVNPNSNIYSFKVVSAGKVTFKFTNLVQDAILYTPEYVNNGSSTDRMGGRTGTTPATKYKSILSVDSNKTDGVKAVYFTFTDDQIGYTFLIAVAYGSNANISVIMETSTTMEANDYPELTVGDNIVELKDTQKDAGETTDIYTFIATETKTYGMYLSDGIDGVYRYKNGEYTLMHEEGAKKFNFEATAGERFTFVFISATDPASYTVSIGDKVPDTLTPETPVVMQLITLQDTTVLIGEIEEGEYVIAFDEPSATFYRAWMTVTLNGEKIYEGYAHEFSMTVTVKTGDELVFTGPQGGQSPGEVDVVMKKPETAAETPIEGAEE